LVTPWFTGLAFNVIKKAVADLKTFDVKEAVPPPPPPPPPKDIPPPPVVARRRSFRPAAAAGHRNSAAATAGATGDPRGLAAAEAVRGQPAQIKGDPSFGITSDDYPPSSQRNGEEGVDVDRL